MADIWSNDKRSEVMSRIKSKDTKPEKIIRSTLHKEGYRFRLHGKQLPGKPDIIFPKYKTVIFVHGCFWHQHKGCIDGKVPKTRTEYWKTKFQKTAERDKKNQKQLKNMGWQVLTVWECEIEKNPNKVLTKITKCLK